MPSENLLKNGVYAQVYFYAPLAEIAFNLIGFFVMNVAKSRWLCVHLTLVLGGYWRLHMAETMQEIQAALTEIEGSRLLVLPRRESSSIFPSTVTNFSWSVTNKDWCFCKLDVITVCVLVKSYHFMLEKKDMKEMIQSLMSVLTPSIFSSFIAYTRSFLLTINLGFYRFFLF